MWLEFDSLVNARDLGGTPTTDGGAIAPGRLIRSDNLQALTAADIARLREIGVSDVVDLRSSAEVNSEGPGPLLAEDGFSVHHLSMFREDPVAPTEPEGELPGEMPSEALPWVGLTPSVDHDNVFASHYLSYLRDRPDSVLTALRTIGTANGATLVHCAAGKDRTGTITALALLLAGAEPDAVVADYAASSARMQQIVDKLMNTRTYADNLRGRPLSSHMTNPETMAGFIDHLQREYGGVEGMVAGIGWTAADNQALRTKLRS
ncbi:MAG: tyrosine-protein phosphatase [Propionibacteriales bacterium]|nr:tyrosine-protein phosphatase [Propionibacteriales bacterium]